MTIKTDKQTIIKIVDDNDFDAIIFDKKISPKGVISISKRYAGKKAIVVILPDSR